MAVYLLGSQADEVVKIQQELKRLEHYKGPIDGIFGGGTETAVKAYQRSEGLEVDGKVGPETWASLFEEKTVPEPAIVQESVARRCLALTGSFETGRMIPECFAGLSGDFDEQGISLGVLQWNFGQGTLQPLLKEMKDLHGDFLKEIFDRQYDTLVEVLEEDSNADQMRWARAIQHPTKHYFYEPWRGLFKTLCRTEEFQKIQEKHSTDLYKKALGLSKGFDLWSERAVALMFDIKVQNGSISGVVRLQIEEDFRKLEPGLDHDDLEVQKMCMIANRRAEASNPRWVEDVRERKLCCARGKGKVHGINYDLEAQFGISLRGFS